MPRMKKLSLVDALAQATSDDLTALERKIAEDERSLEALRELHRVLSVKFNGKLPPNGKPGPCPGHITQPERPRQAPAEPAEPPEDDPKGRSAIVRARRRKIGDLLVAHGGQARHAVLMEESEMAVSHFQYAVKCPWFERLANGDIRFTAGGRREFEK